MSWLDPLCLGRIIGAEDIFEMVILREDLEVAAKLTSY